MIHILFPPVIWWTFSDCDNKHIFCLVSALTKNGELPAQIHTIAPILMLMRHEELEHQYVYRQSFRYHGLKWQQLPLISISIPTSRNAALWWTENSKCWIRWISFLSCPKATKVSGRKADKCYSFQRCEPCPSKPEGHCPQHSQHWKSFSFRAWKEANSC